MLYEKLSNGQIIKVEDVQTKTQTATVKTYYDQEFHTKVTSNKSSIIADGIDTVTIIADIYSYLEKAQTTWTGDVIFVLDGQEQIVSTTTGKATIDITSTVVGEILVQTKIPDFRNGEVVINVG